MNLNDNQDQTEQVFKKEDAYQILTLINAWIDNIDTKISFALALVGVIIGFTCDNGFPNAFQRIIEVTKLVELNNGEIFAVIFVGFFYLTCFLSIVYFMLAIKARIKNPNNAFSLFFFGSIGKMELLNYKEKVNKITEKELIEDLEEQIHTNSRICNQKVNWYNKGINSLFITVVLWFICITFNLI